MSQVSYVKVSSKLSYLSDALKLLFKAVGAFSSIG